MKKILVIGKPSMDVYEAVDYLKMYFQILLAENTQNAPGMIRSFEPDLLLIVAACLDESTTLFFNSLRLEHADLSFMTIGTMDEKRNAEFCLYTGIEHIAIPFDGKRAVQQISQKLGIQNPLQGSDGFSARVAGKKKVLVVDDDTMNLRHMKGLLDPYYQVMLAAGGERALQMMERTIPSLLILDYEMPGMNGIDVFTRMQQDELLSLIPVVFMSSVNEKERILQVVSLKPQGYLLKPITLDKLLETTRRLIGS